MTGLETLLGSFSRLPHYGGVMLFDHAGLLVYSDRSSQELLGLAPAGPSSISGISGRSMDQILPGLPADAPPPEGKILSWKHERLSITVCRLALGEFALLALLAVDDKEEDLAGQAVDLSQRVVDLQSILDNAVDEIYVTDGSGNTLFANNACERLYGIPSSHLIGRNVSELEKEGIFFPAITPKVLSEQSAVTVVQDTSAGRKIMASANPIFDANGHIVKIVTVSRDVTQFYRFQQHIAHTEDLVNRFFREMNVSGEACSDLTEPVFDEASMKAVVETIRRVARFDSTVLFMGESGTGKDTLADLLVRLSPRLSQPFIKVNCGAIPDALVESELFGYESGAFTGARRQGKVGIVELAHHGTLLLDEIDCLPLHLQVKLLHLIQDRQFVRVGGTHTVPVDIRILATSNRDLQELVRGNRFRQDLYYRLNVVQIRVPPLRERPNDIHRLTKHFVKKISDRYGVQRAFSPSAIAALENYSWPGNVRELENIVERCVVTSIGPVISVNDLPDELRNLKPEKGPETPRERTMVSSLDALQTMEKEIIVRALDECASTRKAAQRLGVSQATVIRRMRKYGIPGKHSGH